MSRGIIQYVDPKRLQRALEQIGQSFLELARALEPEDQPKRSPERLLSVAEVASGLSLAPRTIREAIRRGELVASRAGHEWRISPTALAEWLKPVPPPAPPEPPPEAPAEHEGPEPDPLARALARGRLRAL